MHIALSLLPLLLSIPLLAALLKFCAFVYKKTRLTWKRALLVSVSMLAAAFLSIFLQKLAGGPFGQVLQLAFSVAAYVAIGAVLLGPYCTLADGLPGSAKTGLAIVAILVAFSIALQLVLSWFLPAGAA